MTEYDLSQARDFATFMALTANNQGLGGGEVVKRWGHTRGRPESWRHLCGNQT